MLTTPHMNAALELNLPSLTAVDDGFVVNVPALLGQVQRYRCRTLAHAQRFLEMIRRALRHPKNLKAGWPHTR